MQTTVTIPTSSLRSLFDVVFRDPVKVATTYSDLSEKIKYFNSPEEIEGHLRGRSFESYALHYLDCGGNVEERRIALNPSKCGGHTFRYSIDGWGLILIQITEKLPALVECRIAVNTVARAEKWADTYPEYGNPLMWNWKLVEKHARRLIRHVKKIAAGRVSPDGIRRSPGRNC